MKKGSKTPFIAAPRLQPVASGFQILEGLRDPSAHVLRVAHIGDVGGYVWVLDRLD